MEKKIQSCAVTLTLVRQCPRLNLSELFQYTTKTHTHTETHTHTHTDAHKDSYEYSIVAFCKNATIIIYLLVYVSTGTLLPAACSY